MIKGLQRSFCKNRRCLFTDDDSEDPGEAAIIDGTAPAGLR